MTKQAAYCQYLMDWAESHSDSGYEGCTPACFDEWLGAEGAEGEYAPAAKPEKPHFPELEAIMNRCGQQGFGMVLTHLFDVGYSNVDAALVAAAKQSIAEEKPDRASILAPRFQHALWDTALELTQFSIWTLLRFVKDRFFIQ